MMYKLSLPLCTIAISLALSVVAEKSTAPVIGIDLGTTYCSVAVFQNGKVVIIPDEYGNRRIPSIVSFTTDGNLLFGKDAFEQLTENPENTIFATKRLIGRSWSDMSLQHDLKYLPFQMFDKDSRPQITIKTDRGVDVFTLEEITAIILGKLKAIAENYLGETVFQAVITVPTYFSEAQRSTTKIAGNLAGFTEVHLINTPAAAVIAYCLDKGDFNKNILVFDLGGGTFSISLLNVNQRFLKVLSSGGDTHLGGEDFNQRITNYLARIFKIHSRHDVADDAVAMQKLRSQVEKAIRSLSTKEAAPLKIQSLSKKNDFSATLTKKEFEDLNMDLFQSTLFIMAKVLSESKIPKDNIDEIILVGGSTQVFIIQKHLRAYLNRKEFSNTVDLNEGVTYGAAIAAYEIYEKDSTHTMVISDISSQTVGIETHGGLMSVIIPRNTALPANKTQIFTFSDDQENSNKIRIYEGERPIAKDNRLLGEFNLQSVASGERGRIEIIFELDTNGILNVKGRDLIMRMQNFIIIQNDNNRISSEEFQRTVEKVNKFVKLDPKRNEQNIRSTGNRKFDEL